MSLPPIAHDSCAGFERQLRAARARLISLLQPAPPAELPPYFQQQWRSAPADPAAAEAQLRREFNTEVLLATHCFEPGRDGRMQLIDGLRSPDATVMVVQSRPEAPPLRIVAAGRRTDSPALATDLLADWRFATTVEQLGDVVLVCDTLTEAARWWRIGLPAAPFGDVDSRTETQQRKLFQLLNDLPRPVVGQRAEQSVRVNRFIYFHCRDPLQLPDDLDVEEINNSASALWTQVMLIVPRFDPASFAVSAAGGASEALLARLERQAPAEVAGGGYWSPAPETLAAMAAAVAAAEWQRLYEVARLSLTRDVYFLGAAPADVPPPPRRISWTELQELADSSAGSDVAAFAAAKQRYLAQLERDLVEPMLTGGSNGRSEDRALDMLNASNLRRFCEADVDLLLARPAVPGAPAVEPRKLQEALKLGDQLLRGIALRQRSRRSRGG